MKYSIRTTNTFERNLKRLHHSMSDKIWETISEIQSNPYSNKELAGQLKGLRVARIGDHRLIYTVDENDKRVILIAVRPRERAYE